MPVPTYDQFIEPILRHLAAHPDGASARDVHDAAADVLGLNALQRQEVLPSGAQAVYKNRAGWAHDRLKRAGLSSSVRRGYWKLTPEGLTFSAQHSTPLSPDVIEELATANTDVRLTPEQASDEQQVQPGAAPAAATASPDDRLEGALVELRQTVRAELLETLAQVSPTSFETIVLDLLHRMGYGTSRTDLQRVGGSGDGGIDGIISLDRLGLEKVYVQAKRWQNVVGRPDVQAFYGALAGQRANKGVFITTSSFTSQAVEFARSVERVVLVDGAKLTDLMIDHEIGVTLRPVKVPKIDSDYFEE
jgi:restriction system protein